MFFFLWIAFSSVVGGIAGYTLWQDPELGGVLGLILGLVSIVIHLMLKDDPADNFTETALETFREVLRDK